jgi:prepilin-type N-terminal cleavage/methylation domain-containing protein
MTRLLRLGASSGMLTRRRGGYTLIELVVALFLFAVGGLAMVATSAVIGRELSANATRERAARSAATRLEILAAECRTATGGRETLGGIESEWSVAFPDSSRVSLVDAVTYPTRSGNRTDLYGVTLPCRP